jgi:hypothetical protein
VPQASAFIYCYGKEPGFEAAIAAKFFKTHECSQEYILNDIIDLAGPAEQSISQNRYFGGEFADDSLKSGDIALLELFNQEPVVTGSGHNYHIRQGKGKKLTKKLEDLGKIAMLKKIAS